MTHRAACRWSHFHVDSGPVALCGPVALYLLQWPDGGCYYKSGPGRTVKKVYYQSWSHWYPNPNPGRAGPVYRLDAYLWICTIYRQLMIPARIYSILRHISKLVLCSKFLISGLKCFLLVVAYRVAVLLTKTNYRWFCGSKIHKLPPNVQRAHYSLSLMYKQCHRI